MFLDYFLFALEALLPALATTVFFLLDKYTKFSKLRKIWKQIIYGVVFGFLACIGTHFGVQIPNAVINARDAAVVSAGLVFGTPAGFIAGIIGGVERIIAPIIDKRVGTFTTAACSISTTLAGIVSGLFRKFIFDDKRPGLIAGFFTGFVIEVFHLFMVFVLRGNEYQKAFSVVQACTPPMLIANSLGVLASLLVIFLIENRKIVNKNTDAKGLTSRFIVTLSGLTIVAFILSSVFVYAFQGAISEKQTFNTLNSSLKETSNEVRSKTIEKAYQIRESIYDNPSIKNDSTTLAQFALNQGVVEINLINADGIVEYSTYAPYIDGHYHDGTSNLVMSDFEGSREFNILLQGETTEYVQDFRPMVDNEEVSRKYAAVLFDLEEEGFHGYIQVGYDRPGVDKLVDKITEYKKVGENGLLLILNETFTPVSQPANFSLPEDLNDIQNSIKNSQENKTFEIDILNTTYYGQYVFEDTHYIVSLLPLSEARLLRNISIFVNTFLEIIVYGLFFTTIYLLTKKLVIDRIHKTNKSLSIITSGDLTEVVDGGKTTEFVELATGINSTVKALEGYIDAANKRIDEELAMAKTIQAAVLPSTFPAFPNRKEFDIYASMHPAKEVGGDFYDFYFSHTEIFHITIADVSGKGIPAALFMMRAKSILKSLSQTNMAVNEAFMEGNNSLCDGNEAGMFVTAWSASINLTTGILSFANGGHNPPLIKRKDGKFEYLKAPANLVLGAMSGMPYKLNEVKLEPGDIVYLYTDGVTEGVNDNNEQFGEKRLQDALNSKEFESCKDICDTIYNECVKFADGTAQFDDITMLAFKYK